ncbi:MAG: 2-C-methyl-D-erythritol 4-phosphate cytidylyltransferase, partial [Armatimonadota bacterium]
MKWTRKTMAGVYALMPAAGRGDRFGGTVGKLLEPLRGRTVLEWSLDAVSRVPFIEGVVLIAPADQLDAFGAIAANVVPRSRLQVVAGGQDRQSSVANGMAAVPEAIGFLVHDAARPCASPDLFDRVWKAALDVGAATAAVEVHDTLVRAVSETSDGPSRIDASVPRERVWRIETPQGFRASVLRDAHAKAERDGFRGTDDAGLVRAMGAEVRLVPSRQENPKVTRPEDLAAAQRLLDERCRDANEDVWDSVRIGHGYDVHVIAPHRPLWLGGVEFPDAGFGLLGHSDADVVLHALCDALLGAVGLGDIGRHFPDNDPAHKDRASIDFLIKTRAILEDAGWSPVNVDVTVLAEVPRIGPAVPRMRAAIATALAIGEDYVS